MPIMISSVGYWISHMV